METIIQSISFNLTFQRRFKVKQYLLVHLQEDLFNKLAILICYFINGHLNKQISFLMISKSVLTHLFYIEHLKYIIKPKLLSIGYIVTFGNIIMEKIKQQLNQYFPQMPTWANIESVIIVQPNGKILSQYCQITQRQKTIKLPVIKNPQQQNHQQNNKNITEDNELKQQKRSCHNETNYQNKMYKDKLQYITKQVIDSARKLFRQAYQKQLNKIIVDNTLVYYRAKYNVIVIIVVKKFSVSVKEIQELFQKVFNWYYEKCFSMNIQINLPNTKINQYQEGQFKKLEWEIAHEIDQKVSTIQIAKVSNIVQSPKQKAVKQKLEHIAQHILSRQEKIKQIGEKVFFHDIESQLIQSKKNKRLYDLLEYFFPSLKKEEKLPKTRKFKRQLSFMEKSVCIAKQMRLKMLLFYFCMVVALVLGGMVYFGWFRESDD